MRNATIIGVAIAGLVAAPAIAACPPPMPGNTAAEIKASGDRLICLQKELAADTAQRQLQMQIDAIGSRLRDLELQRQFDRLPQPPIIR